MKKRKKHNWFVAHKKIIALAITIVAVVLIGLYYFAVKIFYINQAADQVSMLHIRELIVMSVEDLKKDVPIDAKTGDLYFPESKLFLSNPKSHMKFTYAWHPANEDSQEELSVSLSQVPGTTNLYSARNIDEMFEAVPKFQSCSRGVKLLNDKITQNDQFNQLKRTIQLKNGKELYIYTEKDCSELDEVVDLLSNIQSY